MTQNIEPNDEDGELGPSIGLRVRTLRRDRGWTVNELALKSGLSVGIVSQIERDRANPSLKTMERIRKALGVSMSALLEDAPSGHAEDPSFVRRLGDRPHFNVGPHALAKQLLSPRDTQGLQFMLIAFPPGAKSEEVVMGVGEKAGLVLKGKIRLVVGQEQAELSPGDSFQFASTLEHQVINEASEPAEILWIMGQSPQMRHL
ncbi:helix-turn-helix domain-containing protein [Dongia sp.]|uniref:helix-turn-helix domain-containing protein n=1 Tax=Dongia sp. TaxID=1977262 RepID=UPI0037520F80